MVQARRTNRLDGIDKFKMKSYKGRQNDDKKILVISRWCKIYTSRLGQEHLLHLRQLQL